MDWAGAQYEVDFLKKCWLVVGRLFGNVFSPTGSPWESCADDALAEIIRGAQAVMQQRAEAKAAAAAEEAAASSPVPALSPVLAEMAAERAAAPVA